MPTLMRQIREGVRETATGPVPVETVEIVCDTVYSYRLARGRVFLRGRGKKKFQKVLVVIQPIAPHGDRPSFYWLTDTQGYLRTWEELLEREFHPRFLWERCAKNIGPISVIKPVTDPAIGREMLSQCLKEYLELARVIEKSRRS